MVIGRIRCSFSSIRRTFSDSQRALTIGRAIEAMQRDAETFFTSKPTSLNTHLYHPNVSLVFHEGQWRIRVTGLGRLRLALTSIRWSMWTWHRARNAFIHGGSNLDSKLQMSLNFYRDHSCNPPPTSIYGKLEVVEKFISKDCSKDLSARSVFAATVHVQFDGDSGRIRVITVDQMVPPLRWLRTWWMVSQMLSLGNKSPIATTSGQDRLDS